MVEAKWISDWDGAKRFAHSLKGRFKSSLFRVPFGQDSRQYPFKSLVLHDGGRLCGVLTCRYERKAVAPGVHHIWMVGDFDTAKGTHGMGRKLLETFMQAHGRRFTLGCWDDVAERFWRHMADAYGLSVSEIGKTPWGYPRLLFQQI